MTLNKNTMNSTNSPTPRTDSIISAIDMDAAFQDLCCKDVDEELAPVPEEPVGKYKKTGTNCQFCGSEVAKNKEFIFCLGNPKHTLARIGSFRDLIDSKYPVSNSEWRELGEEEVICEGDEYDPCYLYKKEWVPVRKEWIGTKVTGSEHEVRFRTRRPLPKQKWIPNPNYETATHVVDPKLPPQDEMPLEGDIEDLEEIANDPNGPQVGFYTRRTAMKAAVAIRYLRDEIQKLKQK